MERIPEKKSYNTTIPSTLDAVDNVSAKVYSFVAKHSGNEEAFKAGLVVIEVCTNIVKYGYKKSHEGKIWIRIDKINNSYTISIEDESKPFNPLDYENIAPDKKDAYEHGGMGIFLIKSLSKDREYSHIKGRNKLTITI
ncbi:MAG: ATP-binding protein [Kosmotogaceae bacterium]